MEIDDITASKIKAIYSAYHARELMPEEALDALELVINGEEEEDICYECGYAHDEPENSEMSIRECD